MPFDLKATTQQCQKELNFDLSDTNNSEHSSYKNYQLLLTLNPDFEEFKYILLYNLFEPITNLEELKKLSKKNIKFGKTVS